MGRYNRNNRLEGETRLSAWLAGCPNETFTIYPEIPMDYKLTTEERISVKAEEYDKVFISVLLTCLECNSDTSACQATMSIL